MSATRIRTKAYNHYRYERSRVWRDPSPAFCRDLYELCVAYAKIYLRLERLEQRRSRGVRNDRDISGVRAALAAAGHAAHAAVNRYNGESR